MAKVIDIHAHINFAAFDNDRDEVMKRAKDGDVWMINVGTDIKTSHESVELAKKYGEGVYATVGLHPNHTDEDDYFDEDEHSEKQPIEEKFDRNLYENLAQDRRVVAIGECGLDYFRMEGDKKNKQKQAFIEQIHLANDLNKPLMLHIREAYKDAYEILKSEAKVKADAHFFAGDWDMAKKYLDLGYSLSFTGVLTFTSDYNEVVKNAPIERIMSETDCPYVAPVPHRGKRNEPLFVREVVKRIAEIKGLDQSETETKLFQNAREFFGI